MKYVFHEVRTPLNSVTMGIELLQTSKLPIQTYKYLEMMKDATDVMTETLNNVLNIQKIEEGKFEIVIAPFSIKPLLQKLVNTFQGSLQQNHITIKTFIFGNEPKHIYADKFRIEHVIYNFVSNAIKFSSKGSDITLKVYFLNDCENKNKQPEQQIPEGEDEHDYSKKCVSGNLTHSPKYMKIKVIDNGIGIPKDQQVNLFKNFVQINANVIQNGKGSGLGLFICKKLVELHGGVIGVSSVVGKGSTFFFTIPICQFQTNEIRRSSLNNNILPNREGCYSSCDYTNSRPAELPFVNNIQFRPLVQPASVQNDDGSCSIGLNGALTGREEVRPVQEVAIVTTDNSSNAMYGIIPHTSCHNNMETGALEEVKYEISRVVSTEVAKAYVVDDVLPNRKILTSLLKQLNVVCDEAVNGKQAVEHVLANMDEYMIIFMDNIMPVMTGVEATQALRDAGYPYLIIGVTGNVMDDDVRAYMDAGADMVVGKPLKRATLQSLIVEVITNGYLSKPGMKLIELEGGGGVVWVRK